MHFARSRSAPGDARAILTHEVSRNAADVESVAEALAARDRSDRTRAASPLVRAPDAIYIDTTHAAVDDVVREVLDCVDAGRAPNTRRADRRNSRLLRVASQEEQERRSEVDPPEPANPAGGALNRRARLSLRRRLRHRRVTEDRAPNDGRRAG